MILKINNLRVSIEDKFVLNGVDLIIQKGEIHALMGPNGSGKSTLAQVIAGNPQYEVTDGEVLFDGSSILDMEVDERARQGVFLAFQYPVAIPGVPVLSLMRAAYNARHTDNKITVAKMRKLLEEEAKKLHINTEFIDRAIHEGFSGGEKKKLEMLQMAILKPKMIILDETDSGLDVDALQVVAESVNAYKKENPETAILLITHYQRILRYIKPDHVHVMKEGKIVRSGDAGLAEELEKSGYQDVA